jgi:hypothetical protein
MFWLRCLARLREFERSLDVVAEVLRPGPLGLLGAKLTKGEQAAARLQVERAVQAWRERADGDARK